MLGNLLEPLKVGRIFVFCLLFLSQAININAQFTSFHYYSIQNGLSQSVVKCILQDSHGFIWVGTQDGLNRFDGYGFQKFINDPFDSTSISSNWIYSIAEDAQENIWVGTRNGLNMYDSKLGKFKRFLPDGNPNSITSKDIYGLFATKNNTLLINTQPVISVMDLKSNRITNIKAPLQVDGTINDENLPIIADSKGDIWFATNNGLVKYFVQKNEFKIYSNNRFSNSLSHNVVTTLYEDRLQNIWIGTQNGLNLFQPSIEGFRVYNQSNGLINGFIRALVMDKKGVLWIGTQGNGLVKAHVAKTNLSFESITTLSGEVFEAEFLSNSFINTIVIDNSDNLWLGTLNGLGKIDLKPPIFKLYRKTSRQGSTDLLDNVIASIYKDNEGLIWIGNWGKGLNVLNRKSNSVAHYSTAFSGKYHIPNDFVHYILQDFRKNIWIGTRGGVFIYNKQRESFEDFADFLDWSNPPDFSGRRVFQIMEDSDKNIWIATSNGLFCLNVLKKTHEFYDNAGLKTNAISDNLIYSIAQDHDKDIWIGTTHGLDMLNVKTNKITHYYREENKENTLCDNFIVSLCVDHNNDVWIGTKNGVNRFNKASKIFAYYSVEKHGLSGNTVYEIVEDKSKNLWFATGGGLSRLDEQENRFLNYSVEDGLQSLEFNLKASHCSNDGELFFGGMQGFNSFYPDSIRKNLAVPNIVIASIETANKDGKKYFNAFGKEKFEMSFREYEFTIQFAALEFTNPAKNQFKYQLEGVSDDWIEIGNRRFVVFSGLSPGKYLFKVLGSNNDGIWSNKPAILEITIHPPWWRSRLAYVAYILFFIIAVFLFIRLREMRLRKEKIVLERKVEERTHEIAEKNEELRQQKEEIIAQRDEIMAQKDMVVEQRDQIFKQKKSITDSIQYARRIQRAVLPAEIEFSECFKEYFILYLPKDIVSGDFYWLKKIDQYAILAAADCTGHGVPGAFVSLLGISFLNELVQKKEIDTAAAVLNQLRQHVKNSLNQRNETDENKDGMDLALIAIDMQTLEMQYAAANNPIYLLRNNDLQVLEPDKMPIGAYLNEAPFKNHQIQLQKDDIIYLFSDGYADQFGGNMGTKFMRKFFKELLFEIHSYPLPQQKQILLDRFEDWRGDYEQIDDIMVLGVKI